MSLKKYGVLKGHPVDRRLATYANAHYQVHVVDETTDYRIAVNVRSQLAPSEVEYLINDAFQHPLTVDLAALPVGFNELASQPQKVQLGNKGGIITLLNSEGLKVDGVSYPREQGRRGG